MKTILISILIIFGYFYTVLFIYHIRYVVKRNKIFKVSRLDKYKMEYFIQLFLSRREK